MQVFFRYFVLLEQDVTNCYFKNLNSGFYVLELFSIIYNLIFALLFNINSVIKIFI